MANPFLSARTSIESLLEEKEKIIKDAGNLVAGVMMKSNQRGTTDMKAIVSDAEKLINGFTDEEKIKILQIAMAKLVINL